MTDSTNKALWIFPNFLESINELPEKQRADVWRAVCEYGLGNEIDINSFKPAQKMCIKMLIPLLKLRNTGGSLKKGDVINPNGFNKKNAVSYCNIKKQEDNPYPNPQDNPQDNPLYNKNKNKKKEQEQEQEYKQEQETLFEEFWALYTPIKKSDGYFVPKQDKKGCRAKFIKLLENGENYANIRSGLEQYLKHCQRTGTPSCGVSVFLNQRRWESDYGESQTINSKESRGSSDLANAMRGFLEDTYS